LRGRQAFLSGNRFKYGRRKRHPKCKKDSLIREHVQPTPTGSPPQARSQPAPVSGSWQAGTVPVRAFASFSPAINCVLSARASAVASGEAEPHLPIDGFVRASKPRWPRLEMGKAVFDGSNGELALHMELRLEPPGRKEVAIDPPEPQSQDIDEKAGAAVAAEKSWISFQSPGRRLAADDTHGVCSIDGFGHVSAAVDDLAIVRMAVELGDRFAGNFDFDCAAAACDSHRFGHGFGFPLRERRARVTDKRLAYNGARQVGACAAPQ
jgi:hypothetical protein